MQGSFAESKMIKCHYLLGEGTLNANYSGQISSLNPRQRRRDGNR